MGHQTSVTSSTSSMWMVVLPAWDSSRVEKPPYHTSPAPVDVATEGLIPLRLIGYRRCRKAAWTLSDLLLDSIL